VAIAPLLVVCGDLPPRRAAITGGIFGIAFFGTLLAWITIVGYVAWILLVLLQAAFTAVFAALYAAAARGLPNTLARVAAAASLWVAVDLLRANVPVGGFTWGQLAQSQTSLWTVRPAALGGAWLVAWLLVAVNACFGEAWRGRSARITVGALLLLSAAALVPPNAADGRPVDVALVQGNVPRSLSGVEKEVAITTSHARLTQDLDPEKVDVAIWPESSLNLDLRRVPEVRLLLADAAQRLGRPIIAGGNLDLPDDRYRVMAFLVSPDGEVVDRYQKTHLVPFGEYVPARDALGWIPMLDQVPRDAVPGSSPRVFRVAGGTVAPVISFEGDFGSLVRKPIAAGGRLLVVATNTSTWGESWASAQHVAFSRLRAVENGVWVAHAAISGISAVIAPDGRVVSDLPMWTSGTLVERMAFADGITLYARAGDWAAWGSVITGAALLLFSARRRSRVGKVPRHEPE
jgi:apolipoprotein N-acyltransferase